MNIASQHLLNTYAVILFLQIGFSVYIDIQDSYM